MIGFELLEFKFEHLRCPNEIKVACATYNLHGAALAWWQSQVAMQPNALDMSWDDFKTLFRRAYVPESLIRMKRLEFRTLKQGRRSVDAYLQDFEHLARYAERDVSTEPEKIQAFMHGLSEELQEKLITHDFLEFRALVDKARLVERASQAVDALRKRRREDFQASKAGSSHSRPGKPVQKSSAPRRFTPQQAPSQPRQQQQQNFQRQQYQRQNVPVQQEC